MAWKRPKSEMFPQIWWTFEAKDPDTEKIVKYRVQDLPDDRFDDVVEIMKTIYIRDEAMCKSKDRINDDIVGDSNWRKTLEEKLSIVCFKEGSDEICGFNLLGVSERDVQKSVGSLGQKQREIIKAVSFVTAKADIYNRYKVDKFLSSCALLVLPKYRGLGLATEILRGRIVIGKALGFKVTGSTFAGFAVQRVASKVGFVEDYSVLFEDLAKYEPYVEFPNIASTSTHFKYMSYRLDDCAKT